MRLNSIVERVLRDLPSTRSSDKELYLAVWEELGFFLSDTQRAKFKNLPATESIRRIRQKLQEQGFYSADERIKRHRHFKGMEVRQKMPTAKPYNIENLIENRDYDKLRQTQQEQASVATQERLSL